MDSRVVLPHSGAPVAGEERRERARELVDQMFNLESHKGGGSKGSLATPLATSRDDFALAVPRLLSCLTQGDAHVKAVSAELLAERAHWITSADLNDFVIPALRVALPQLSNLEVADRLLTSVLLTSPLLTNSNAVAVAKIAFEHIKHEGEFPAIGAVSLGVLGSRMPRRHREYVAASVSAVIERFRGALDAENFAYNRQHPANERILQVAVVSLFGLRKSLRAHTTSGKPNPSGERLRTECRESIFAIEGAVERGSYPQLPAYYHLLCTAALVDPQPCPAAEDALYAIEAMIEDEHPVVAYVLQRFMRASGFLRDMLDVRDVYDPYKPEAGLVVVSALMDSILWIERGAHLLSEGDVLLVFHELEDLLQYIHDPCQAHFVFELQRTLKAQFPDVVG